MSKKTAPTADKSLRKLARTLQEARLAAGLTQERLAERLDVAVETIGTIEQGRRLPGLLLLIRICRELRIKITIP